MIGAEGGSCSGRRFSCLEDPPEGGAVAAYADGQAAEDADDDDAQP